MALSDCPKCWETPCICGHAYQNLKIAELEDRINMFQGLLRKELLQSAGEGVYRDVVLTEVGIPTRATGRFYHVDDDLRRAISNLQKRQVLVELGVPIIPPGTPPREHCQRTMEVKLENVCGELSQVKIKHHGRGHAVVGTFTLTGPKAEEAKQLINGGVPQFSLRALVKETQPKGCYSVQEVATWDLVPYERRKDD